MTERYDVIIVGTGFAGSFFLMRYLERATGSARVLVLDRGRADPKDWQLRQRATSSTPAGEVFFNRTPRKAWLTSPGFGGNSKCWWAGTMRMLPSDFRLRTLYGVGDDWPVSYDDLERHYSTAEQVMLVSGPEDLPMWRSRPFPLPPHVFSRPDELLKQRYPQLWFHPATARASVVNSQRGLCGANGLCDLCPNDAKFTIQNGLAHLYRDSRVTLLLESAVEHVDVGAEVARGVQYRHQGRAAQATGDLIVLAASALFNPHILLRSGVSHPVLGKRLHEQLGVDVCVDLDGVDAYGGSTVITGNGYMFYDGPHRGQHAACMVETWNSPFAYQPAGLRAEPGRWRQRQYLRFLFEDLPSERNAVTINAANPDLAETSFHGYSDYALNAARQIPRMVDELGEALPVERIVSIEPAPTCAHVQGTTVMGNDSARSIVDRHLVHHRIRNLLVLGAGVFPTGTPILPTLTVSALSMWAADYQFAPGAIA